MTQLGRQGADHPGFPVPTVFGSGILGALTVAAAVKLSLRWGRQERPARRWMTRAAGAGLAVYGLVLLLSLGDGRTSVQWVDSGTPVGNPSCLVNGAGEVIENLYPYDVEGRLLGQVLLYDQTGRPVDNLCPRDYDEKGQPIVTEYGRDQNGAPVINVFPRRQTVSSSPAYSGAGPSEAPTTSLSPRPVDPPAVVVPRVVTTTTATAPPATTDATTAVEPTTTPAPSSPTTIGSGP